jgi:hypothetical protein
VLLLTAQRRDKVATMKWDDIAGDTWTIASAEHNAFSQRKQELDARPRGSTNWPPAAIRAARPWGTLGGF